MMPIESSTGRPKPEVFISPATESPQYMFTVYRDSHGTTRTLACRETPSDTWGHEVLMVRADVAGVAL
jgi:hypothetical protein